MTLQIRGRLSSGFTTMVKPLTDSIKSLNLALVIKTTPQLGPEAQFALGAEIARSSPWILNYQIQKLNIESAEVRGQLAEVASDIDLEMLRQSIQNFNLPAGSPHLYNIVVKLVTKNPLEESIPFADLLISSDIEKIKALRSTLRFKMAADEIASSLTPEKVNLDRYQLSESQHYEIIKIIIDHVNIDVLKQEFTSQISNLNHDYQLEIYRYIDEKQKKSENDRFEASKAILERINSKDELKNFDLELYQLNEKHRIALAQMYIKKDPYITDAAIKKMVFGVTTDLIGETHQLKNLQNSAESIRFEDAKKALAICIQSGSFETFDIEFYRLNEEHRIAIAQTMIEKNPYLNDIELENMVSGKKNRSSEDRPLISNIMVFGDHIIKPALKKLQTRAENIRFEDAKKEAARTNTLDIRKYRLTEEHHFEIAKLVLQKMDPISKFPIEQYTLREKDRFEIAKRIIDQSKDLENFPIERYALTGDDRFELCRIMIAKNPFLSDDEIKILAPRETAHFVSVTPLHIILSDHAEKKRFALAKEALSKTSTPSTDFVLGKFNIKNKNFLLELALQAIKKDPQYIQHIIHHKLDEKDRIHIATTVARIDGEAVSKHIKSLDISDENELFAIACSALNNNKKATAKNLMNYGIRNEAFLTALFALTKEKPSASKTKEAQSTPNDYSQMTDQELRKEKERCHKILGDLSRFANDEGAREGEKANVKKRLAEMEYKLKAVEQEMRKRRI